MSRAILEVIKDRLELRKAKYHPDLKHIPSLRDLLVLWHDPELGSCVIEPEKILEEVKKILKDPSITDKRKAIIQRFREAGWDTLLTDLEDVISRVV